MSPAGIEPATLCLEGRCSIQLSYGLLKVIVAAPDVEKKTESATRARVAQPPPAVRIPVWHSRPRLCESPCGTAAPRLCESLFYCGLERRMETGGEADSRAEPHAAGAEPFNHDRCPPAVWSAATKLKPPASTQWTTAGVPVLPSRRNPIHTG